MASAWLDRYLQGSFRGVEFYLDSHSVSGGRRLAKHTFPFSDEYDVQDVGKKDPDFSMECYIVGDDYFAQRNKLENALNAEGAGLLVHPYRGKIKCFVDSFTLSESTGEGRKASFSIKFIPDRSDFLSIPKTHGITVSGNGSAGVIVESVSAETSAISEKATLFDSLHKSFTAAYDTAELSVNKLNKLVDFLDSIDGVLEDAKTMMSVYSDYRQILSNAEGKLIAISIDAESLIHTLEEIIDYGTDSSKDVEPTSDNAFSQFQSLLSALESMEETPDNDDAADQLAFATTVLIAGSAATLLMYCSFSDSDSASEAEDSLYGIFDSIVENYLATDDEIKSIRDLRSYVHSVVQYNVSEIGKIKSVTIDSVEPNLSFAYKLYGDLDNDTDLIDRNKIENPLFVPAGIPLEVLINEA